MAVSRLGWIDVVLQYAQNKVQLLAYLNLAAPCFFHFKHFKYIQINDIWEGSQPHCNQLDVSGMLFAVNLCRSTSAYPK